jgi:hypothetical protein
MVTHAVLRVSGNAIVKLSATFGSIPKVWRTFARQTNCARKSCYFLAEQGICALAGVPNGCADLTPAKTQIKP